MKLQLAGASAAALIAAACPAHAANRFPVKGFILRDLMLFGTPRAAVDSLCSRW